jgi:hypothetical protein
MAKRPVELTPPAASVSSSINPSQRDPDSEEPETPVVVVLVEDRLNPVAVVVERLVIEPALIDPTPAEVGRWWSPLGATRPTVVVGPAARVRSAPLRPAGPSAVAGPAVVVGTTGTTVVVGTTRTAAVAGTTRPSGSAAVALLLLRRRSAGPATARPAWSALALALAWDVRAARRTARLGCGKPGACGQCGEANADDDG